MKRGNMSSDDTGTRKVPFGERVTPKHDTRHVPPNQVTRYRERPADVIEVANGFADSVRVHFTMLGDTLRIEVSSVHWPEPKGASDAG